VPRFQRHADCDEIRMLTGRAAGTGVCWHDAWEFAGTGPGHTWSGAVGAKIVGAAATGTLASSDHYGVLTELRY
jgi:hypothetical protein